MHTTLFQHYVWILLIQCHSIFCSELLNCKSPPCYHHIQSNLSWYGPVAMTSESGYRINFAWNISIHKDKCCPGMVVFTSTDKEDLISKDSICMDIAPKNLDFLYATEKAFIPLDYHYLDSTKSCHQTDNSSMYWCKDYYNVQSPTAMYAAAYLYYPCQKRKGLEMTYNVGIEVKKVQYKCFELNAVHSVCSKYYQSAFLPNLFDLPPKDDIEFNGMFAIMHIQGFQKQCHKHFEEIVCRAFLPECKAEGFYLSPCQSVVREVLYACRGYVNIFNNIVSHGNNEFIESYYISKLPTEGPCFDISVHCDNAPTIDHGSYIIQMDASDVYHVNTSVIYTCDANYALYGESTAYCSYSGDWKPMPRCVLIPDGNTKEIITASVLGSLVFTVIISIFLIIRYRQEIAVILYAKYGCRFRKLAEKQCKYDAFVAYNLEDIAFVKNEIMSRLENADPPYSVCIHHRVRWICIFKPAHKIIFNEGNVF